MDVLPVAEKTPVRALTSRWWKTLFEASEDAQVVCRTDGVVEQINPRAARLLKLQPETANGSFCLFTALSSPADQKLRTALGSVPERAGAIHSVTTLVDRAPRTLVDLEIVPLGDGYTLVTFRDASRRLRLESHVQRLLTAIDATPDVFFITDADLRLTFVNPAFQTTTGYGLEEVLGRPDEFLRAPSESAKVSAYLESVTRGQDWIGELVNQRSDGTTYPVEATISPIADMAGRFIGYVACERDLTVRRRLQDELCSERDFVQSILHSLDGAIYSLDCDFRITHANDGWRRLPPEHGGIRLAGAPVMGRSLLDYVPDTTRREELRAAFQQVLDHGDAQENRFHAADGRHWLVKISPWIDGREVRGLICSIADQTHFHDLQDQLFQAQKMEIIGTLAAGVAHDFNNLLQAIRGHASLLMMQVEKESAMRQGLDKIHLATIRAAEITKQLLSFSRASQEKRAVLDLNLIIKETGQLARRTLRSNVALELHPAPKPIAVKMDSTRASQALLNLCVNAQDAMPEGGRLSLINTIVELPPELAKRRGVEAGRIYARCSVADTGCGIAPDVLPRIFQPFFTTKETGKGTGLGLSIVHRVAKEAGGFIEVESTLGKGTTFHCYLPLAQEQLTAIAEPVQTPLTRCSGRVLVVDDVDLLCDFTKSFLQAAGLTVFVANRGAEALKVLERETEPVDLLFTDYNMPEMNGVELIEKVAVRWPATRFILASGYLDEATRARVERCNATILAKPYDMRDAAEIVMRKLAPK